MVYKVDMSSQALKQQAIQVLYDQAQSLSVKEIARQLLNLRQVSGYTLDQLADRIHSLFMIEIQTRKEMSILVKMGARFTLRSPVHSLTDSTEDLLHTRELTVQTLNMVIDDPSCTEDNLLALSAHSPLDNLGQNDQSSEIDGDTTSHEDLLHIQDLNLTLKLKDYPLLHHVQQLLSMLIGRRYASVNLLYKKIKQLQNLNINSQQPDLWITQHCSGQAQQLAMDIWQQSGHLLNPYFFCPMFDFIKHLHLINPQEHVLIHMSARGQQWITTESHTKPNRDVQYPHIQYQIDVSEGILLLLAMIIEQGPVSFEDLVVTWRKALIQEGKRKTKAWITVALRTRLQHLQVRGLIERNHLLYLIKEVGLSWLRQSGLNAPTRDHRILQNIWHLLHQQQQQARESVRTLLSQMPPLQFEGLICELLERMGYHEIYLTPPTHDLGIDVIAQIELGITAVKEVIQVKRQHKNIQRATLDALRGSLHRFDAVRGTLICTSDFSKGTKKAAFERGAAPITLINGDKLIDLLMTYQLGLRKTEIALWQVEPRVFEENHLQRWPRFSATSH
jgi:restriction system protein